MKGWINDAVRESNDTLFQILRSFKRTAETGGVRVLHAEFGESFSHTIDIEWLDKLEATDTIESELAELDEDALTPEQRMLNKEFEFVREMRAQEGTAPLRPNLHRMPLKLLKLLKRGRICKIRQIVREENYPSPQKETEVKIAEANLILPHRSLTAFLNRLTNRVKRKAREKVQAKQIV